MEFYHVNTTVLNLLFGSLETEVDSIHLLNHRGELEDLIEPAQ